MMNCNAAMKNSLLLAPKVQQPINKAEPPKTSSKPHTPSANIPIICKIILYLSSVLVMIYLQAPQLHVSVSPSIIERLNRQMCLPSFCFESGWPDRGRVDCGYWRAWVEYVPYFRPKQQFDEK